MQAIRPDQFGQGGLGHLEAARHDGMPRPASPAARDPSPSTPGFSEQGLAEGQVELDRPRPGRAAGRLVQRPGGHRPPHGPPAGRRPRRGRRTSGRPDRTAGPGRWSGGAPTSCSSGGRSAVQAMSGTPARSASATAACSSAVAVPLVVSTTAGWPVASPMPRAVKAAERSSSRTCTSTAGWATRARARGVDRDPGHTTAWASPPRAHSSTTVVAKAAWMSAASGWSAPMATLARAPMPLAPPSSSPPEGPPVTDRLHTETIGAGQTVVLAHGFTQTGRVWGSLDVRPGRRPPGRAGRPARPRPVGRSAGDPGRRGQAPGRCRGSGQLPRLLDGGTVLPAVGPGPAGHRRSAGAHLGHRRHRRAPTSAAPADAPTRPWPRSSTRPAPGPER